MDFPWMEILDALGLPILGVIILCMPWVIGTLIGQIIQLFRNIFSPEDIEEW